MLSIKDKFVIRSLNLDPRHWIVHPDSQTWLTSIATLLQLGVAFPVVLEANHVVDMRTQVWAGAIAAGIDGKPLTVISIPANPIIWPVPVWSDTGILSYSNLESAPESVLSTQRDLDYIRL